MTPEDSSMYPEGYFYEGPAPSDPGPEVHASEIPATLPPDAGPVDVLGERIAVLSAQIDAATWHLLHMIAEFDDKSGWDGWRSCAHWLNWRTGLAMGAAREKVRVAKVIRGLPVISEAMRRGELSYSKVRAVTRVATPENEAALVAFAKAGTAAHVERLVRYVAQSDADLAARRDELQHESRHLELTTDEDGMVIVRGRLTPEVGAVLRKALEAAAEKLYQDQAPDPQQDETASQRRADAIGVVAEAALASGLDTGNRGDRYQVVVHSYAPAGQGGGIGASSIEGTGDVSAETSLRLSCDSSRVAMKHGPHGQILDVGRKRRTVPPAIRRALIHRDQNCRFPGCGLTYCDAHHVKPWSEGGETKLANLLLLCRRHHRSVHEGGWRVSIGPDGSARFVNPAGRHVPEAPQTTLPPTWPRRALIDRLEADGVQIAPEDVPRWGGEPCDWRDAVENVLLAGTWHVSAETPEPTAEVARARDSPNVAS
jgi:hypothetical protein